MPVFIAVFLIVAVIWIIIAVQNVWKKRCKAIVERTSELLARLDDFNKRFSFDWSVKPEYKFHRKFNSKKKLDRCDFTDILDEFIEKYPDLLAICAKLEKNRKLYKDYCRSISVLKSTATKESVKGLKISFSKYIELETALFEIKQLHPVIESKVVCMATYSSPQGRNKYSRMATCDIRILPRRNEAMKAKQIYQNSEAERRKRERALMTDKLRYSILKRDGFKCKICGRTADEGVKLHVDHIIPVSKGGKTVPSNLRTLCEACNLGKSNEIE